MDYNYLLLLTMLPPGRYDGYRKRFERKRFFIFLNYFCAAVCLFCGVKYCIIIVLPLQTKSILYLCELYIYEIDKGPALTLFQLGMSIIHLTNFYVYLYMAGLCRDTSRFDCLRFLFTPNLADLCKGYDLNAKATQRFLQTSVTIRHFVFWTMIGFELFFFVLIGRCLVIAYLEIELKYFLVFTVPLSVITWFSYYCLLVSIPLMYTFMFTTQAFLRLRFESVAEKVRNFHKSKKCYRIRRKRLITETINDIVQQFNESNLLFDDIM